jgi:hypothetical protein
MHRQSKRALSVGWKAVGIWMKIELSFAATRDQHLVSTIGARDCQN